MNYSESRRRFLLATARAVGAGAALSVLPPGIQKALAIPPYQRNRSIEDVGHIVIFMLENRAFDHYFGTLRGVRGFGDPAAIQLPTGKSVWHQPAKPAAAHGEVLPFRPDVSDLGRRFMKDLWHDWTSTHRAWDQGRYDKWVIEKTEETMAYMTRDDIPYLYQLADAFTICDAYHCSVLGETEPNRYYLFTGWTGNNGKGGGPALNDDIPGYSWHTFPEVLQRAGISWKVYQDIGHGIDKQNKWGWAEADPFVGEFGCNVLPYFDQYRNARPGSALYDRALRGTDYLAGAAYLDNLRHDVENNSLPQVSWIVAPQAFSEHPSFPPDYGIWYTDQVLQILTSNPEVWSRTVLFINWDENDGFFDHVPPPFAAASPKMGLSTVDTTDEFFAGNDKFPAGPYGLGPRVPMLVVSPWSRGGWVCSEVFDHTSVIRFVEARFGHSGDLAEKNITAWRRTVCGDMTSAFDFASVDQSVPDLPDVSGCFPTSKKRKPDYVPESPAVQTMPRQEMGIRAARPLPYQLTVRLHGADSNGALGIEFANTGRAGANFLLYRAGSDAAPRSYTVEKGKRLVDHLAPDSAGRYDFTVHGPNGFLRCFAGRIAGGGSVPTVVEAYDTASGNATLTIKNPSDDARNFNIVNAYAGAQPAKQRVQAHASVNVHLDLHANYGWYNVTVTADSIPGFRCRLAGHVETGRRSISDPALGRA